MRAVSVVAALISRNGEVLVQRRPAGKARASLWEFPGGKREAHEGAEAALARECREELGLTIEVLGEVWSTEHRYEDLEVRLQLFRAKVISGRPEPLEGQELRWVRPIDLPQLPFVAADVPVLDQLARGEIAL
jgi:8-oxo-dGTP diphosphatase